jgi:hypothetical protein
MFDRIVTGVRRIGRVLIFLGGSAERVLSPQRAALTVWSAL